MTIQGKLYQLKYYKAKDQLAINLQNHQVKLAH